MEFPMTDKLTHATSAGDPTMVDVGDKKVTTRIAEAVVSFARPYVLPVRYRM